MPTIKHRRATKAQWAALDPVLAAGEVGFEIDTNKLKVGNGLSPWTNLVYFINENIVRSLIGSGGGGGGSSIDDGDISLDTTWSSEKVSDLLKSKTDDMLVVFTDDEMSEVINAATGEIVEGIIPTGDDEENFKIQYGVAVAIMYSQNAFDLVNDLQNTKAPTIHDHEPKDITAKVEDAGKNLTVNASGVAEWATPSGSGGAAIDDGVTGTNTTWSSKKTSDSLDGKTNDVFVVFTEDGDVVVNAVTGEVVEGVLPDEDAEVVGLQYGLAYAHLTIGQLMDRIQKVDSLPSEPVDGVLYLIPEV